MGTFLINFTDGKIPYGDHKSVKVYVKESEATVKHDKDEWNGLGLRGQCLHTPCRGQLKKT